MAKVADKNVKIFEYEINEAAMLHTSFENDDLIKIGVIGTIGNYTDMIWMTDLYNALHDMFTETGLDPKDKNDKKLKVS